MKPPNPQRAANLDRALGIIERIAPFLFLAIVVAAAVLFVLLRVGGTSWVT